MAKKGAQNPQPERAVTFITAKQIIKSNMKIDWMNSWAQGTTARTFYQNNPVPNKRDKANSLPRKYQTTIFRLRTGHIALNAHLNRIIPNIPPNCDLCGHHQETIDHHLFKCPGLDDLRSSLLPPKPDNKNCLYSSAEQLKNTCEYHFMALARRAKAQRLLDR